MHTVLVNLDPETTPLSVRQMLAFQPDQLSGALLYLTNTQIGGKKPLDEVVIVSTHDRVEIYVAAEDVARATHCIRKFLSRFHQVSSHKFEKYLRSYSDSAAVEHLFAWPGQSQGNAEESKVRDLVATAFARAQRYDTTGIHLSPLFRNALSAKVIAA